MTWAPLGFRGRATRSRVLSVKQSPLNEQRWCLNLECGHEVWITAKRRPTRKLATCELCERKECKESNDG